MDVHSHATKASRSHSRPFGSLSIPLWIIGSCVCGLFPIVGATAAAPGQPAVAMDANKPAAAIVAPVEPNRPCPFTGLIMANDVLVRSGPGTHFYQCAKLFRGDKVDVLKEEGGWSQVVPPPGSFSWIAMEYVGIDVKDRTGGIVTGEGVVAYAGTDLQSPLHSPSKQAVLRRGDRVKLLGQDTEGYLKIACPSGSSLWVSSRYIEPVIRLADTSPAPVAAQAGTPGSVPAPEPTLEEKSLKEFYQIQEKFKAEVAKPLMEQDYTSLKKPLTALANAQDAGKAAQYARHLLERITSCELAKQASKELQQQDKQFADSRDRIEKARQRQLALTPDLGRFSVIGTFQTSSIFGGGPQGQRFRVTDETGRVLSYAEAVGTAASLDLAPFVGQKVGLVGTVKPYPVVGGALVEFTEIVKVQ